MRISGHLLKSQDDTHLRDKLDEVLKKMEENDIIEDAIGPTPWVSELLVIPKPNKPEQIRVVIDSRAINVAIERARHNSPVLDELVDEFNEAKIISKLDQTDSFHQMELHESSRYITVFRTPRGLKRYKRVCQGVNSATEEFHHEIERRLEGLKGV
jgi:hypothetical protein